MEISGIGFDIKGDFDSYMQLIAKRRGLIIAFVKADKEAETETLLYLSTIFNDPQSWLPILLDETNCEFNDGFFAELAKRVGFTELQEEIATAQAGIAVERVYASA